ncbi:Glutamine amidotransferase, class-II [Labilithrix luteola]|uniref:Glutamine amidotransferase, class-II n=1 Tax=Labilithrix luteola TaxID=1391654 RepID=A0A0K1QEE1_9BACT|nr:class II glutamine amidotransferase [Labilithrix luteola]AKV04129.1 Glutamine amidotransferase, class-II [Labilithrix luteola]
MCRLLGIVASEPTEFGLVLTQAPRCLATLSREHPDGWGIAIHDPEAAASSGSWDLYKGTERAGEDVRFHEIAARSRGHVLVAHIRQKTVGPTLLENTHPFSRDGWVFAHNGTVQATDYLRERSSAGRLAEIAGQTDSELLFAYLLTRLDERGLSRLDGEASRQAATETIAAVTAELREARIGAFNFLLSDGVTCFAHRCGRSLFLLELTPSDPVRERRSVAPGTDVVTKWTPQRHAVFVASEKITDEPWTELPEGTFMRIERLPTPRIVSGTERAA